MSDRRASYRHNFAETERMTVELTTPAAPRTRLIGRIVDLSVSGFGVMFDQERVSLETYAQARFVTPGDNQPFSFECKVIHRYRQDNAFHIGCRFLPLANPSADENREKNLWRFLMAEQLRQIKQKRERAS